MDIRKIKKLIDLIQEKGIGEIEIKEGEQSVRIRKATPLNPPVTHVSTMMPPLSAAHYFDKALSSKQGESQSIKMDPEADPDVSDGHEICAPVVGTVYLSASPGRQSFVRVGQMVTVGQPLCIVEAMKVFNEIESDRSGRIKKILVKNAQPVEYGQVLFVIE